MNIKNIFKKQPKQQQQYVDIKYSKLDHIGKVQRIPIVQKEQLDNINNQIDSFKNELKTIKRNISDLNNELLENNYFYFRDYGFHTWDFLEVVEIDNLYVGVKLKSLTQERTIKSDSVSAIEPYKYYYYKLYITEMIITRPNVGGGTTTPIAPILFDMGKSYASSDNTVSFVLTSSNNKMYRKNIIAIFKKSDINWDSTKTSVGVVLRWDLIRLSGVNS